MTSEDAALQLARELAPHFAPQLIEWQRRHGRHHLPWQGTRDAYRVWLSEIMLQQTQVSTVLDYYARFLARFPTVAALAAASEDEVMGLWSGLGYYSRARNLHRCAQCVVAQWDGHFPRTAGELASLPGIGRSTAAAIAAFCFGERVAILDGNVKRVLARVLGFEHDLSRAAHVRVLWSAAQELLPNENPGSAIASYTQALMDLGAQCCTPRRPRCSDCPVRTGCRAQAMGAVDRLPLKLQRVARSAQTLWLLLARCDDGSVWLQKRPPAGIWAGLYALPVFDNHHGLRAACESTELQELPPFVHVLTHRDLHIHPIVWHQSALAAVAPRAEGQWVDAQSWPRQGLPAPVRMLLVRHASQRLDDPVRECDGAMG